MAIEHTDPAAPIPVDPTATEPAPDGDSTPMDEVHDEALESPPVAQTANADPAAAPADAGAPAGQSEPAAPAAAPQARAGRRASPTSSSS